MILSEIQLQRIHQSRQPLIIDDFTDIHPRFHKIFQLDPGPFYEKVIHQLNPFKRQNWLLMEHLFPDLQNGLCSCGCEKELSGRRTRWSSDECKILPLQIFSILTGRSEHIKSILFQVYEYKCFKCERSNKDFNDGYTSNIHLEHTLSVKHGGGGCWLSNYKFMCVDCHRNKTNADFGWKTKQKTSERFMIS